MQRGSPVPGIQHWAERVNYYTTVSGDDPKIASVKEALWRLHFAPHVFKKGKREAKAKGVDIALTRDMLVGAFMGHYETAVLVSGDADYLSGSGGSEALWETGADSLFQGLHS